METPQSYKFEMLTNKVDTVNYKMFLVGKCYADHFLDATKSKQLKSSLGRVFGVSLFSRVAKAAKIQLGKNLI